MTFIKTAVVPVEEIGYITAHVVAARMRDDDRKYIKAPIINEALLQGLIDVIEGHCEIEDKKGLIEGLEKVLTSKT